MKTQKPKQKKVKAWAVINKITGYMLWGKYGYFILMSRGAAEERRKKDLNNKIYKVVPCIITLNSSPKKR